MRSRIYIASSIVMLTFVVTVVAYLTLNFKGDAQHRHLVIPVEIQRLEAFDGTIPFNLLCENIKPVAPNQMDRLSCVGTNNSDKEIVALVVSYTVFGVADQKSIEFSGTISNDILMHPDLFQKRKNNFVRSGATIPITVLPTTFDQNFSIEKVSVQVSYVEYSDGTSLGKGSFASNLVFQFREGFAVCRDLFKAAYKDRARSKASLDDLLQKRKLLERDELSSLSPNQIQGAKMFQKFIRRILLTEGEKGVKDVLK